MTAPTIYRRAASPDMVILPGATERRIRAVLATDTKQRDGLSLDMNGVNLTRYRRNPALLIGHETHKIPIGTVDPVEVEQHRLVGTLNFGRSDAAQSAKRDVLDKICNFVSIGFDPDRNATDWRTGVCRKWSLTETSLIGIPMDEGAHIFERAARASGLNWGELLAAVELECERKGIDPSTLLRGLPQALTRSTTTDPETCDVPVTTDAPAQVDVQAAQDFLAAFSQLKGAS